MSSHPHAPPVPPRLVPRWLAWTVVAGSLGLAAALIPSRRQLVGRLLEDGQNRRAMEVARHQDTPESTPASATPLLPLERLRASLAPDFRGPGSVASAAIENAADPAACDSFQP